MSQLTRSLRRIALTLTTAIVGFALAAGFAPNAAASTTLAQSTANNTVSSCSTWQYWTDSGRPIYGAGSEGQIATTTFGVVNVTGLSGSWRWGNFYWYNDRGVAVRYATGWIHVTHIHYRQCW